jgi:hypothetical protein
MKLTEYITRMVLTHEADTVVAYVGYEQLKEIRRLDGFDLHPKGNAEGGTDWYFSGARLIEVQRRDYLHVCQHFSYPNKTVSPRSPITNGQQIASICGTCSGFGGVHVGQHLVVCPDCNGEGE